MDLSLNKSNKLKETFTSDLKHLLFQRLEMKGMKKDIIPSYIRSMKICLVNKPNMNPLQANEQLQLLGWNDIELDYHTIQLAIACFETEGIL